MRCDPEIHTSKRYNGAMVLVATINSMHAARCEETGEGIKHSPFLSSLLGKERGQCERGRSFAGFASLVFYADDRIYRRTAIKTGCPSHNFNKSTFLLS